MQIIWMPLDDITRYGNNPRNNARAVEKVAASIREFGWQQPIVVDSDHVIIAGDTRYQAAQLLGLDEVPVLVAANLSPEKVRAYRLADNKTGEFATWDDSKLADELAALMAEVGSIELSGFAAAEFDALAMQAQAALAQLGAEPELQPATVRPAPASSQAPAGDAAANPGTDDEHADALDEAEEGDAPPAPVAMVPFNLLMSVDDRQAVYDAINAAKAAHGVETSADALAIICREYSNA